MSRRLRLTPEIEQMIVAGIRAGGYPHVAAEAAGVPAATFADWLRLGQQKNGRRYRPFCDKVPPAQGQARLKAEIDAREADARFWLRHGPGKETADAPGWTTPVKAVYRPDAGGQLLASAEWGFLWLIILQALQEFPDARAALVQAVEQLPPPSSSR